MVRKLHIAFVALLSLGAAGSVCLYVYGATLEPGYHHLGTAGRFQFAIMSNRWSEGIRITSWDRTAWRPISDESRDARREMLRSGAAVQEEWARSETPWRWGGFGFDVRSRFCIRGQSADRDDGPSGTENAYTSEATDYVFAVHAPLGFTAVVCAVYPGIRLIRYARRRRRRKLGLCLCCGYDLRGTLDAGRCPECGTGFEMPTNETT